jgi:hypothetical protein
MSTSNNLTDGSLTIAPAITSRKCHGLPGAHQGRFVVLRLRHVIQAWM